MKYHHVAKTLNSGRSEEEKQKNLANLFIAKLRQCPKNSMSGRKEAAKEEGTLRFRMEEFLKQYAWDDIQGWIDISSQFMLARSFSFFRLVEEDGRGDSDEPLDMEVTQIVQQLMMLRASSR